MLWCIRARDSSLLIPVDAGQYILLEKMIIVLYSCLILFQLELFICAEPEIRGRDLKDILMNEMACRFVHESRRILVAESDIFLTKSMRIIFIPLVKTGSGFR